MNENFTVFRTVFIGNLKNFGKEKKLSEDSVKLKKYLQKDLFEQQSCIFIIFCSRRAPHFGQSLYLHLYFCSPFLWYFPNLTIFSCPHLGHVILVFIGGDLLLNGGTPQMSFKIFINIILKIIKKLTQLFKIGGSI